MKRQFKPKRHEIGPDRSCEAVDACTLRNKCGGYWATIDALVLDDLLDAAHRALLKAIAAGDACFLVHNLANAVYNLDALLRARVDADAAADALVGIDHGMRHDRPLLFSGLLKCFVGGTTPLLVNPMFGKIPQRLADASRARGFSENGRER